MQPEFIKSITEFVTAVTTVYVDSAKKIYDANMTLATEMTKAMTKLPTKK